MSATNTDSKYRILPGILGKIQRLLFISLPIMGIIYIMNLPSHFFRAQLFPQQYGGIFFAVAMLLAFTTFPANKNSPRNKMPWYDIMLALAAFVVGMYVAVYFPQLNLEQGVITPIKTLFGIIAVICILEAIRRIVGWTLVFVAIFFVFYARFTNFFPGLLEGRALEWPRIFNSVYLGVDAIFGQVLMIIITTVLGFVLFGALLTNFGASEFMLSLVKSMMGKYRGGPAKVSVIGSTFFGMLSGSPVANTSSTGVITIPLMKKVGYKPYYAGAVEASSSTGGVLVPPIMGAAAFLMAQFMGISYSEVVIAAIIPGILYYIAILTQVDLNAARNGLKGMRLSELPNFFSTLKSGWIFLVPIAVLIYTLMVLYLPAAQSALYSSLTLLVIVFITMKDRRQGIKSFIKSLEDTGRGMISLTVIGAVIGIVIGIISVTGLGSTLPQAIIQFAGGNLFLILIMTAIASIILGMGVNMVAAYALLAVVATPALLSMGVEPLAAHFFVFYFGALSFVTPPIALAAFTAATIADSNMMKTSFQAVLLSIAAYIVPFALIYNNALLGYGYGSISDVLVALITCSIAIIALCVAFEGYLFKKIGWFSRIALVVGGILMIFPSNIIIIAGSLIVTVLVAFEYFAKRNVAKSSVSRKPSPSHTLK